MLEDSNENVAGDRNPLPENPKFPEGLRVLAVDDDPICLKTLSAMLQNCQYQVTQTTKATEALALLRENTENYDIVITDVKMPDMDGFELLRIIGLEMDVPVIMMSANDETDNVMKGVRHGARDYLVKPVRIMEIKNIWQHVMRKTLLDPDKSSFITKGILMENLPLKKRRETNKEKEDVYDLSNNESSVPKKRRFAWTKELHIKFVDAVHQLDADKAVPKRIVEIMNEPQITREIVASHLQKYRNFLRKQPDITAEDRINNTGQNRTGGGLLGSTPTTSEANNCSSSSNGVISFCSRLSKPETLSNSLLSGRLVPDPPNPPNLWSQQNIHASQVTNQVQPSNPVPVFENAQYVQAWVPNPSRQMALYDHMDMPSHIPSFGPGQPGPPLGLAGFATGQSGPSCFPRFVKRHPSPCQVPLTGRLSYPHHHGVFDVVGTHYQLLEDVSNQTRQPYQLNAVPGQCNGRVLTAFNGKVNSDYKAHPTGVEAIDEYILNDQGLYMQLRTENMDQNHHNSFISVDDELYTNVKQPHYMDRSSVSQTTNLVNETPAEQGQEKTSE